MPHIIRLRAAWQRTSGSDTHRIDLPDSIDGVGDAGSYHDEVSYHRAFNSPTGINDQTPVTLVIEQWEGILTASLDGKMLAEAQTSDQKPLELTLDGNLTGHHKLVIVVRSNDGSARLIGPCYLSIE